jgi:lipoprotein-anchoring transpeptidase ErfK/SrfK
MTLNRRDFLKLSGAGLLGLLLPDLGLDSARAAAPYFQGRVVYSWTSLYDAPSFQGNKLMPLPRDTLLTVTEQVQTTDKDVYNPIWYQIGGQGFIYSGWVQPVENILNEAVREMPAKAVTAEVTVPVMDTYWKPSLISYRGPRMYYSTTHWIIDIVHNNEEETTFYFIYDDLWKAAYYANAENLRLIPAEEVAPLSASVPNDYKLIEVNLKAQRVTAYEGDLPVRVMRTSTGTKYNPTPKGWFKTFYKRSSRHMAGGNPAAPEYDLPGVPWVTYINDSGVSFHGTYWHNDYGTPHSHGCINLTPSDAKWLFRWTTPNVPPDKRFLYLPGEGVNVHIF